MTTLLEAGILCYFVYMSCLVRLPLLILRKGRLSILNSIDSIYENLYKVGLQIIGKYHIIHSVLETQALLIFLKVKIRKLKKIKITVDMKL